jgi:hypothetical protein
MAQEHPFQHLFETLARPPSAHAELVNRRAYGEMADLLSVPTESPGRCILLRATRAGHGKTHLLSRLRHLLGGSHEFVPLHPAEGCRIDARTVIDDTLRSLLRPLPASGGVCLLDLVTRRLFAMALQPLVGSGEVPCQDREGALSALRLRPVETFDFHHPTAVTAHWAKENFEILGQRLGQELAYHCGLPVRGVAFWVDAWFHFASAPVEHSGRVTALSETVDRAGEGEMERLEAMLGLVSQLMRVVLVADDVEGFSSDETAALRFAAFLGTLRESVQRLDVILSINRDIWESAFLPRLSDGLADRLSEVVVELEPLNTEETLALLESRTPGLGSQVLERIDLRSAGTHARGVIRAAGIVWQQATAAARIATPSAPAADASMPEIRLSPPPPPASSPTDAAAEYFSPPPPPVEIAPAAVADPVAADETADEATQSVLAEIDPGSAKNGAVAISPETAVSSGPRHDDPPEPDFQASEEMPEQGSSEPPAESSIRRADDRDASDHALDFLPDWNEGSVPAEPASGDPPVAMEEVFQGELEDEPVVPASGEPSGSSPDSPSAPVQADTERVDDLLRQFRERYGRGSL